MFRYTQIIPALVFVMPAMAHAQSADPSAAFDDKMVERLKKILEASPQEGFVLDKIVSQYKTFKSLDVLLQEYETKATADPSKGAYQLILGLLYKSAGRDAEAKVKLEAAAKIDPKNTNITLALAGLAEKANNTEDAKRLYEQSLSAITDKIAKRDLLRRLISIYLKQKNPSQAKEYAIQLAKTDPGNIYVALEYPQMLRDAELYEEAIAELNRLLASAEDGKSKVAVYKEIGAAYEAKGEFKTAIETYEKALGMTLKGNSARADLRERIISAYRKKGELTAYVAILEKEASGFEEMELLGRLYEEVNRYPEAAQTLEKALKLDPKHLELRERLISLYDKLAQREKAIEQYRILMKAAPNDARWPILLAERLHQSGSKDEALKILGDMRKRHASDPAVRVSLADLYGRFGAKDEALKEFEALVKLEPKEESHLVNLGEAYWELGRKPDAETTWKKLLTIIPELDRAHAIYAETIESHGYFKDAIASYKIAIEKNPNELNYQINLAKAYRSDGQSDNALAAWEKIKGNPKINRLVRREAREQIIAIYKEKGSLNKQIDIATKAFAKTPPDLEQGAFLAMAYSQTKDKELKAIEILQKLITIEPSNTEFLSDLVTLYEKKNDLESAISLLEKLATLEPARAKEHYLRISKHLAGLRRDGESLVYAEKALALSTSDAQAYAELGEVYRKQAKIPEAISAYEKAIAINQRAFDYYLILAALYREQLRFIDSSKLLKEVMTRGDEDKAQKAAKQAIDFAQSEEELLLLEKDLLLLFNTPPSKKVYRKILVSLYIKLTIPYRNDVLYHKEKAAAAQDKLKAIGERAMLAMSNTLLDTADDAQKVLVIELLGYFKNPAAVLPLTTLLTSNDKSQQILTAISLGRIGDKSAVYALGKVLGSDKEEPPMRAAAAWALGELKSTDALSYLTQKKFQGINDDSDVVCSFSLFALARLNDPSSIPDITLKLSANQPTVRQAAALSLGAIANPKATEALLQTLSKEGSPSAKIAIIRALGAIGDEAALSALLREAWNPDPQTSSQAIYALANFGAPLALPPSMQLSERLFSKSSPESAITRENFLRDLFAVAPSPKDVSALINKHQRQVEESLREALTEPHPNKPLASLDEHEYLLSLGGLLRATEENQEALRAMVSRLSPELLAILEGKETPENKARVVRIWGKAKLTNIEPLAQIVQNGRAYPLRAEAAKSLGMINSEDAKKILRELAKSPDDLLRLAAANAFGASRDVSNEKELAPLLNDSAALVRSAALRALEQTGSTEASISALTSLSKHQEPQTRRNVARALGQSSAPQAKEILQSLAADANPNVALAAKEALASPKKK